MYPRLCSDIKSSGLVLGRRWRAGPSSFCMTGHGPARLVKFSEDEPWPGPAHQFSKITARPGPARPTHDSEAHETRALYWPARQSRGPAIGFDGPAYGSVHVLSAPKWCMCIRRRDFCTLVVRFSLFFLVWIRWNSYVLAIRHITSTHYSHSSDPPTTRSDGFR